MGRDLAQCDGPARLALESFTARSDTRCDQTEVETANFEVEGILGITKPWRYAAVDGEKSGRAAVGVLGGGFRGWSLLAAGRNLTVPFVAGASANSLKVVPEWLGGGKLPKIGKALSRDYANLLPFFPSLN